MIDNRINFNGRIHFVNNESYKNFSGYRNHINNLKHHCGNNKFNHIIQHDKNFFVITTTYEHANKVNGTSASILSYVADSKNPKALDGIINSHIDKVSLWKKKIGKTPEYKTTSSPSKPDIESKETLFEKFLKLFKMA